MDYLEINVVFPYRPFAADPLTVRLNTFPNAKLILNRVRDGTKTRHQQKKNLLILKRKAMPGCRDSPTRIKGLIDLLTQKARGTP